MLKMSKHHYLSLPDLGLGFSRPLQLTPVPMDDNDDLTRAIITDPDAHDDNWKLVERPDTNELVGFWEQVEHDMQSDSDLKT
jgi:hypothetical protein